MEHTLLSYGSIALYHLELARKVGRKALGVYLFCSAAIYEFYMVAHILLYATIPARIYCTCNSLDIYYRYDNFFQAHIAHCRISADSISALGHLCRIP